MKKKKMAKLVVCKGDARLLVIRNDKGHYAEQFNVSFGIVVWTSQREKAATIYVTDVYDVLHSLRVFGKHVVWAECVNCDCTFCAAGRGS